MPIGLNIRANASAAPDTQPQASKTPKWLICHSRQCFCGPRHAATGFKNAATVDMDFAPMLLRPQICNHRLPNTDIADMPFAPNERDNHKQMNENMKTKVTTFLGVLNTSSCSLHCLSKAIHIPIFPFFQISIRSLPDPRRDSRWTKRSNSFQKGRFFRSPGPPISMLTRVCFLPCVAV